MHFYFYCLEKHSKSRIIFDMRVSDRIQLEATIKSQDAGKSEAFIKYLKHALTEDKIGAN